MKVSIAFDRLRWEEKALKDEADALGISASLVDAKGLFIDVPGRNTKLGDAVLQRCISHYRSLLLSRTLEAGGLRVINRYSVAETCGNKLATTIALSKAGVPTPRTVLALSPEAAQEAADELGFPVVLKPFTGSWGRMVTVVRDSQTLQSLTEFKEELSNALEHMYYMQEYIERPPRDIRAIVAGDDLIACVHRFAPAGEWRTNVARGGISKALKPAGELVEVLLKASGAVGGGVLGVDAMESPNGYLVHEVNNTVEFRGAQSATDSNIARRIMEYVAGSLRR